MNRDCLFCPSHELGWHYKDVGHGPPLILLHGIGMSHFAWKTIINNLAAERRVLAFDIAGFGITPPVPDNIQPTPANLVSGISSLAETLSRIDEEKQISKEYECVDIVGNSLGGYLALDEIPDDVIWQDRNGWGHVPMWDDPDGVTKFILEATT
jgi:pimeloyl-ACP methyl ester carboxylesterase